MPGVPKELMEHCLKVNPQNHSEEVASTMLRPRQEGGHHEGASKTTRCWFH
jgi:hypothetical protein